MSKEIMPDSRYPYTYACDSIRGAAGYANGSTKISRSDASKIYQLVAEAMGVAPAYVAECLADHYKANEEVQSQRAVKECIASMGGRP